MTGILPATILKMKNKTDYYHVLIYYELVIFLTMFLILYISFYGTTSLVLSSVYNLCAYVLLRGALLGLCFLIWLVNYSSMTLSLILGRYLKLTNLLTMSYIDLCLYHLVECCVYLIPYTEYLLIGGGVVCHFHNFHYIYTDYTCCYFAVSTVFDSCLVCLIHKFDYLLNKNLSFENG